ncbi:MAG: hypothetical protein GF401_01620 [Chitinivibrionales bacterium]|nr:hypothetical protein [Chitinivibrionales bacterium]
MDPAFCYYYSEGHEIVLFIYRQRRLMARKDFFITVGMAVCCMTAQLCAESDFWAGASGRTESVELVEYCAPDDYSWPSFTHSSQVTELPNGELGVVWYGGSSEGASNVKCWFTRKTAQGWLTPVAISGDDRAIDNAAIYQPKKPGAPLCVWYTVLLDGGSSGKKRFIKSTDNGATWTDPVDCPDLQGTPLGRAMGCEKNKPLELPDGSLLLPASVRPRWLGFNGLLTDSALFWIERTVDYNGDNTLWSQPARKGHQPAFLVHSQDFMHLQLLCRGGKSTWSTDGGRTWGPVTGFGDKVIDADGIGNSGGDAFTLDNGYHVSGYSHTGGREFIRICISPDGLQWQKVMVVPCGGRNYPAFVQTSDRKLHLTYSDDPIRHVVIDPDKLCNANGPVVNRLKPVSAYRAGTGFSACYTVQTGLKLEYSLPQAGRRRLG